MPPMVCFAAQSPRSFLIEEYPFDGYELKPSRKGFFNAINVMKYIEKYKDKDLSLHSQLSRIFSCSAKGLPEFMEVECNFLKSEILLAEMIGVKQINFHMKEEELSDYEIKQFNEILDFARQHGIEMIYENHVCSQDVIFHILDTFSELSFCLDIGHLNIAMHQGKFTMDLDAFLEKVNSRVVHIHAHNNYGERDEHNALDKGSVDWKHILNKLTNVRKVIIENREEDCLRSKELLEGFYNK